MKNLVSKIFLVVSIFFTSGVMAFEPIGIIQGIKTIEAPQGVKINIRNSTYLGSINFRACKKCPEKMLLITKDSFVEGQDGKPLSLSDVVEQKLQASMIAYKEESQFLYQAVFRK